MRDLNSELNKLIDFANKDDRIRGLVLQGSFVNPVDRMDIFSDLDPLFYVTDVEAFVNDLSWKKAFGDVMIEWGDEWDLKDGEKGYTRLTIYKDGFKLDFGFQHISQMKYANEMALYKVCVDKDNQIPTPEVTDESKLYTKKPTNKEFQDTLLDFYFDTSYVVKSIYRDEFFFTQHMFHILHSKLYNILKWYIAVENNFHVNTGVMGRYFKDYLSKEDKAMLKETYKFQTPKDQLNSLFKLFDMIESKGRTLADALNFAYPENYALDMRNYCLKMKTIILNKK